MHETSYIYGRNAIIEALHADSGLEKIFISFGTEGRIIDKIYSLASKKKIQCVKYDKRKFRELEKKVCLQDSPSQGVIALKSLVETISLPEIINIARSNSESPVLVVLDSITDPHNLGAIARSAECAGASGLILPERDSAPLSPAAFKVSAGTLEYLPVAKVTNLINAVEVLKENGFWIAGADAADGTVLYNTDLNLPLVLVIGSEGKGLRPSIKKQCDILLNIPMKGRIDSLNASVSAGIILFEILRQKTV